MQERQAFAAQQVQMLAENIERDVPSVMKSGDAALKPNLLSVSKALQASSHASSRPVWPAIDSVKAAEQCSLLSDARWRGAPEEIRTPDPQIRSLLALVFVSAPEREILRRDIEKYAISLA